jgi:glycosyltransferase involved in cell wall biosynthesis
LSDRKIRVLQVITRLVTRGASRHVIDLARSLDPTKFEVEIAAGQSEAHERSVWDDAAATGLRCHRVEHLQREISPWADLQAFRELSQVIRRHPYDIVHTHISKSGLLGRFAARRSDVPVIAHTYHGMASEITGQGMRPAILRRCERACARFTDAKISISERIVERVAEAGISEADTIHVIHNGIDLTHFRPVSDTERPDALPPGPVIGTVGSLTQEKSTIDLLRVAAKLAPQIDDLQICIVGDGALRQDLEQQAQILGIADRTLFTGAVDDVRPWLAVFDVFVLPSNSEGLPGALMEAMAMGCPVVATDVGGVSEVVGEAGMLAEAGDVDGIADHIRRLLSDSTVSEGLAATGQRQAQKFSLAAMAAKTGALYEELYSRHRSVLTR